MLVALAGMATAAVAQTRDVRAPGGTAMIAGVVVSDDAEARPIRKARVTCGAPDAPGHTTITDDSGRFAFDGLAAGRYTIAASKPTWVSTNYGARRPMRPGTPVPVADGQRVDLVIHMARGAVITGVLLDPDRQPASGVLVRAMRYQVSAGERRLMSAGEGTTDDRGLYRIYGLAAGDYFVSAITRGLGGMSAGDLRLTSDADVREAHAETERTSPPPQPRTVAMAPAYFPAGNSVAQASAISLRPGEERTGVDFALQLVATARVDGAISLADGGVPPAAEINLIATGTTSTPGLPFEGYRPTQPAGDGTFAFTGVPPGTYTVLARAARAVTNPDGTPAPPQTVWASTQIAVDGQPVTGLSLSLEPGLTIAGRIRFPAAALTPPDAKTVRIAALPADTESAVSFAPPAGSVDANGRFAISGVVPGRYRLNPSFPGLGRTGGWQVEAITANRQDALDTPVTVDRNRSVLDAVVTFTDRLADLSGVVRGATGSPADYTVVLFPEDARLWIAPSRRIRGARPAVDGAYSFANLPAGTYLVALAEDAETGEWLDPTFLHRLAPFASRIVITGKDPVVRDLSTATAPRGR